jgi:hypothetical protein
MPSTYTLNNGIELIGTGEQSGTWGDTTNTNLGLLDAALDGQVTITLAAAGSSGSPNALPITDGTTSNGRNRMVVFADGADLGATAYVQLTPNDAEKIIYIRNSLSGSRSVILFQGTYNASNDYEVPAGTTAVVYFDGAGAGAVAANVFNNAYFDGLRLGSVSVTAILDEDNMASDSATALATQQSIKAYVDSQVGTVDTLAEILAIGNTTGATDIAVDSAQKVQFRDAAIYINSSVDGQLDIVADTEIQIAATTVDLNGALDVSGTALVTGVLTTTAATVSNGGGQFNGAINVGVDDTGYDVKFFGATAGAYMLWDESADDLILGGAAGLSVNSAALVTGVLTANGGAVFNEGGADVDFRVESATTANALFVEGSSGNVGIGASPIANLSVLGGTSNASDLATAYSLAAFNITPKSTSGYSLQFGSGPGDLPYIQMSAGGTASGNLLIQPYGGNVGIGETAPDTSLHVTTPSGTKTELNLSQTAVTNFRLSIPASTDALTFVYGSSAERMRIDSSGNLLVGTTSTIPFLLSSGTGAGITSAGTVMAGATAEAGLFNRIGSDGSIVNFYKAGAIVGSIGNSTTNLLINSTSGSGLFFGSGTIAPMASGSLTDNSLDIGTSSYRYKDLYLSGGVYLGGTVAANLLDDYEEGTWTPILTDDSGRAGTHAIQVGRYVKVGKLVHIQGRVELSSLASMSGLVNLTGFPFANINVAEAYSSVNVSFADGLAITAGENLSATIVPNTTNAQMRLWDDAVGTTSLTTGELSSNGGFIFAATYIST